MYHPSDTYILVRLVHTPARYTSKSEKKGIIQCNRHKYFVIYLYISSPCKILFFSCSNWLHLVNADKNVCLLWQLMLHMHVYERDM